MTKRTAGSTERGWRTTSIVVLLLTVAAVTASAAEMEGDSEKDVAGVEAAVLSFNEAVSERDPDAVAAHFASGAVLLNSRPAHSGLGDGGELAADAAVQWSAIAALLKGATRSYVRTVDDLRVEVDGDLATVWCRTRTETRPLEGDSVAALEFSETYTLFRLEGEWKIAAMANNRPTR